MSFNEIDDTLVAYFKQMLGEEAEVADSEAAKVSSTDSGAVKLSHSEDIDYASDDYIPPVMQEETQNNEPELQVQTQQSDKEQALEVLPYAEHKSLESLLETVDRTHTDTETENSTQTEVASVQPEVATQTEAEEKTKVVATVSEVTEDVKAKEDIHTAQLEKVENEQPKAPYEWENIETPREFQALFFLVRGVRFAVPLVNLGGIFQTEKITPLFGKPAWFMGIADVRGRKMNVVDTLKWVKSDCAAADTYEYMIALDKTLWSIGCDELEGNRILSADSVTWRQTAGNRPWLAGIVKKEMCALLHVEALIKMFENGVNLKDLDLQVSD
ncbi:MAG: chemotaxis protein CheW [Succinivibrio sp.]